MNTYEYRCESCKHEFETQQHFKDKPLKKCPECKKNKLERLISAPAVVSMGPQTLGGFADKKTAKMGQYAKDKLQNDREAQREAAEERVAQEAEKIGGKAIKKKKKEKKWYHSGNDPKKLAKMTEKQKQDYIMKGKLP